MRSRCIWGRGWGRVAGSNWILRGEMGDVGGGGDLMDFVWACEVCFELCDLGWGGW